MARITSRFSDHRAVPSEDHPSNRRSVLVLHNIRVRGHRTSIRLEPQIWMILAEICRRERCTTQDVCSYVAGLKHGSLTSSLRVFMLDYFRTAATEAGEQRGFPGGHHVGEHAAQAESEERDGDGEEGEVVVENHREDARQGEFQQQGRHGGESDAQVDLTPLGRVWFHGCQLLW